MQDPLTLNGTVSHSSDFAVGMIFLHQTVFGFLGNCLLLYYSLLFFTRGTLMSTDLIITHLTVANFLVVLTKGVPQIMAAFGMKHFLSMTGCKLVFYVHRVGRAMCIGTTCVLSIVQAFTISPMTSGWKDMKLKVPRHIRTSNILMVCWMLNMLVYIIVPLRVTGRQNNTRKIDLGYCGVQSHRITYPLHMILWSSYDILCLGLMIWSSGSMVFILSRHVQRVQHIHSTNLAPRSSPESRATQRILILVSTFVSPYTLSSIFSLILVLFHGPSLWLVNTSSLITACFPTVSPFVLMSSNPRLSKAIYACCGNTRTSLSWLVIPKFHVLKKCLV